MCTNLSDTYLVTLHTQYVAAWFCCVMRKSHMAQPTGRRLRYDGWLCGLGTRACRGLECWQKGQTLLVCFAKKNAIFDELWMEAHEHDRFHRVRVAFDDHWLLVVGMLRFSWQQTSRRGGCGVPIDFFVRNRRT
jgi:hypothetical protein